MLAALPKPNLVLVSGSNYTFEILRHGVVGSLSEQEVKNVLSKYLAAVANVISVRRPLFTRNYTIVLNIKVTINYQSIVTRIINAFDDIGYEASIVNFSSGAKATIAHPIIAQATGLTSDIKWILIGGLGIVGLFYAAPILRPLMRRVGKKI